MRVVDLDRDMSDVIPTGTTPESQYLFEQMTRLTLDLCRPGPGRRILDVACGMGQDTRSLARLGATAVGVEPSARMMAWVRLQGHEGEGRTARWVRGWSDALPFADESFDAVFCKGALDHFDRPQRAIEEMARVARRDGRVVLAVANFESLSCRLGRWRDEWRERLLGRPPGRGRRHYDVPADHFTRYELDLMREQAGRALELEVVRGVSLGWGLAAWSRVLRALPAPVAHAALRGSDALASRLPRWADVVVLAGRPRRVYASSTASR